MKWVNFAVENSEHDFLLAEKGDLSWRDFIMKMARTQALEKAQELPTA